MANTEKFTGYTFRIDVPDVENFDPTSEIVDVILITKAGEKYTAKAITRKYEDYLFEKNKRTGECAGGIYLFIPNRISVDEISERSIRKAIDDLIEQLEIEKAFEKID
jgi:hypothetical protein